MRTAVLLAVLGSAACAGQVASPEPGPSPDPAPTSATPPPRDGTPPLPELRTLWDFGDPAASERRFLDAAAVARGAGDTDREAEALTQAARAQGLQDRFDDAERTLGAAAALLRPGVTVALVRWNLELGRVRNSSGRPADAVPLFRAAWHAAREIGHEPLAMDAAHMVAIAAPPEEALEWAHRAIGLAEASADPRVRTWLGPLYHNTGWTCFERGETDRAVALWRKGVEFRRAAGDPRALHVAEWTWARGLRAQGKLAEALEVQERLRRESDAAGSPDGYVHEEIAEILLAQGRRDEARAEFHRAWDLLRDAADVKGDAARSERLRTAAGMAEASAPR